MPTVQEAITRLGSRLSYGEAQEELEMLWGVTISKTSVRNTTMRYGKVAQQLIDEQVEALHQGKESTEKENPPEKVIISTDGAMIHTTSGEWREVKTVAMGEFKQVWDAKKNEIKTKTEGISYFSRLEDASQFGHSAIYEWKRRNADEAQEVVTVNDGAQWIQSFIDYHCPHATRVLDLAHARGYVAKIGKLIHGAESDMFKQWYPQMSKQLYTLPPQRTLNDLRFLRQTHQEHVEFAELDQAIRYLEKREEMIDYPHFRQQGIPIGSGIVESAHRVVMHRRMKQAGMRWGEDNINPMLTLRAALCNQRWSQSWQAIQQQVLASPTKKATQDATSSVDSHVIDENDISRLEKFAASIDPEQKCKPWSNHRFIFPHRY